MRRYSIFLVAVPLALLFVRLGFWQVSRLHQRRALNTAVRENRDLPPLDLSQAPPSALPRFRSVAASGYFDFDHQVVVDARSFEGMPSVIVVTPLRMWAGKAVLVERGYALSLDARDVDLAQLGEPDSTTVRGVVTTEPGPADMPAATPGPWPRHVQWLDPARLAPVFPYEILPYALLRTELPPGAPPGLHPVPLPELNDGPHLVYALQWFAFAVIALAGSVGLFRREAGRRVGG